MPQSVKELAKYDATYIQLMLEHGILRKWEPEEFPSEDGTVLLKCADGERHRSMMRIYREHVGSQRSRRDCHHPLQINGAPVRIAKQSRFNKDYASDVLMEDIFGSIALKRTPTVLMLHHWPCGWAHLNGIVCPSCMRLCFTGKDDIRHEALSRQSQPMPTVRMGMHIDADFLNSCLGYTALEKDDILFPVRDLWMKESQSSGILGKYCAQSSADYVLKEAA